MGIQRTRARIDIIWGIKVSKIILNIYCSHHPTIAPLFMWFFTISFYIDTVIKVKCTASRPVLRTKYLKHRKTQPGLSAVTMIKLFGIQDSALTHSRHVPWLRMFTLTLQITYVWYWFNKCVSWSWMFTGCTSL